MNNFKKISLIGLMGAAGGILGWAMGEVVLRFGREDLGEIGMPALVAGVSLQATNDLTALTQAAPPFIPKLQERLNREKGQSGDIQISLMWDNLNDLDLYCTGPDGVKVFHDQRTSPSGGRLDVDMNARPEGPGGGRQRVVLIVDCSGSMANNDRIGEVKKAAVAFVSQLDTRSIEVAVVTFNSQADVVLRFTSDFKRIESAINGLTVKGGTHLHLGVGNALRLTGVDVPDDWIKLSSPTGQIAGALSPGVGGRQNGLPSSNMVSRLPAGLKHTLVLFTDGYPCNKHFVNPGILQSAVLTNGISFLAIGAGGARIDYLKGLVGAPENAYFASDGKLTETFQTVAQVFKSPRWLGTQTNSTSARELRKPSTEPVENIFWPSGTAPDGVFIVNVVHYAKHDKVDETSYYVGIKIGGELREFRGKLRVGELNPVAAFTSSLRKEETLSQGRQERKLRDGRREHLKAFQNAATKWSHFPRRNVFRDSVVSGMWAAALAVGVGMVLVPGPNWLLLRKRPEWVVTLKLLGLVGLAGFMGGMVLQLLAEIYSNFTLGLPIALGETARVAQLAGWPILGLVLGLIVGRVTPNFPSGLAGVFGMCGGALAGVCFGFLSEHFGGTSARLGGAVVVGMLLGIACKVVEHLAREAAMIVHWDANEHSILNLGPEPVILGSGRDVNLYLPKEKGFPEVTATVFFKDGVVQMDNRLSGKTHTLVGGNKLEIGPVVIEIQTDA